MSLYVFIEKLNESIEMQETLFTNSDRELFENILTQTVSQTLRARIEQSERWTKSMGELMRGMRTSMELEFSLDWTPRKGETPEELDTEQIVRLLRKNVKLLTAEDHQRAAAHFRAKVRQSRESAENGGAPMEYADIIRDALDYRKWYEFRLFFRRPGQDRKPLTDHAFNRFSGGEKAMFIYVPLFAALSAQYHRAALSCPRLLALDEAFAGVDEQNIAAMFELVGKLDFGYIMNSKRSGDAMNASGIWTSRNCTPPLRKNFWWSYAITGTGNSGFCWRRAARTREGCGHDCGHRLSRRASHNAGHNAGHSATHNIGHSA